jgi:hypothetical protein
MDNPNPKHYGHSLNILVHGGKYIGNFKLPANIELVTFNKPNFLLPVLDIMNIFKTIKKIPLSKKVKSQVLVSDTRKYLHDIQGTDILEQIKSKDPQLKEYVKNIRMTVYKPLSENIPNLIQEFYDDGMIKNVTGFYDTKYADINFNLNKFEWVPTGGIDTKLNNLFLNNVLSGDIKKKITTEYLINFLSFIANISYPGKIVRVFLFCCRPDSDKNDIDENMAEKYVENLSAETISPEIIQQPLLLQSLIQNISNAKTHKRKRNSPINNSLKLTQKNHKKLHLKSPSPIVYPTLSKTQKGKTHKYATTAKGKKHSQKLKKYPKKFIK